MKLTYFSCTLTIVFLFVSSLGVNAQEHIDVNKLTAEASAGRAVRDQLSDFTFRFSFSIKERKKGEDKISSMVYDTFTPSAFPAREIRLPMILVEKDGVLLDESKLEAQRKRLVKQVENIERQAAQKTELPQFDYYPKASFGVDSAFGSDKAWEIDVMQVLRGSDFSNPRRLSLSVRETILLDFQARPGFAFTSKMQYFARLKGTIWIDIADKKVVRILGVPNVAGNPFPTDKSSLTVFSYDLIKVADNLWTLFSAELKTIDFPNIFGRAGMDFKMEFANFKRFRSEVNNSVVDAPPDK